jgi:putative glutamine amidotransferase
MRPLIAIPGRNLGPGQVKKWPDDHVLAVPTTYLEALRRAGAEGAVLLPQRLEDGAADLVLSRFDGLVLTGGPDVDPSFYGQEAHPDCYGIDRDRDAFELELVRAAIRQRFPTLAICRGIQVLNVAMGGTLDQHITDREGLIAHGVPAGGPPTAHPVDLEPGSLTAKAMGVDRPEGFSHHHQAIDRLGPGLRTVGRTEDGVVEAVELEEGGWLIGVQWHPEETAARDPAQQGLFDALVEQTGR